MLRKLQDKDPEFPKYEGKAANFPRRLISVEEIKDCRRLPDQVAIVYATVALVFFERGIVAPGQTIEDWKQFVETLKRRLCPQTWNYNVVWRLEQLRMSDGNFQFYDQQFVTGINLLKGTMFGNEPLQQYLFDRGFAGDIESKVMVKHPRTLHDAME